MRAYEDQAQRVCSWVHFKPGCWPWQGALLSNGYATTQWLGKRRGAHRVMYEIFVGPIPEGLQLDHLCHGRDRSCPGGACVHRRCVNPSHLEPVTCKENLNRGVNAKSAKTHCPKGHPYDVVYVRNGRTRRECLTCRRAAWRAWKARQEGVNA